jgi:hypothetical protein
MRPGQGARWQRPAPEPYKSKYKNMKPKLPSDTAEVRNCCCCMHTSKLYLYACCMGYNQCDA